MDIENAKAVLETLIFETGELAVLDMHRLVLVLQVVLEAVADVSREELLKVLESIRERVDTLR